MLQFLVFIKTLSDPRHQRRIDKFKKLFAYSFSNLNDLHDEITEVIDNLQEIDHYIQEAAPEWPVARLNKIDLAILRLAIFELLIEKKVPPKVVIDEAVEIGKLYGSESTAKFVNGVLGTLIKKREKENQNG
jgi:N utilization substance protein B